MKNAGLTIGMCTIGLGLALTGLGNQSSQANGTPHPSAAANASDFKIVSICTSGDNLWGLASDGSLYRAIEVMRIPTGQPSKKQPADDARAKERERERVRKEADRLSEEISELRSRLRSAGGRSKALLEERIAEKEAELAPLQEQILNELAGITRELEQGLKEVLPSVGLDWELVIPAR